LRDLRWQTVQPGMLSLGRTCFVLATDNEDFI
jgi:hypothetical protein